MSTREMIKLEEVTKHFLNVELKKKVTALKEITLSIREGEFLCIIGSSGCGKTTLLKLLAGFDNPTSGQVFFKNAAIQGPRREMFLISQVNTLYPWLTVSQNIEFGLKIQGYDKKQRKQIALESLSAVGLSQFAHFRPHELSLGMKHKVELVRAFSLNPEVLLMDEPFGVLDALSRNMLQDELIKIWGNTKKTVVFVTHNLEEAVYLSDRVIVFTPLPGRVKAEINIAIPRPRSRLDGAMHFFSKKVFSALTI